MSEEIILYLPDEIEDFIFNLALKNENTPEDIITEILDLYYKNAKKESNAFYEGLAMLDEQEMALTISDAFKNKFNEK